MGFTREAVTAGGTDLDRVRLLRANDGRVDAEPPRVVIDTDTYNEIDDQFALVHALLSPDRARTEAVYAAPFHNARSTGPGDGMAKSYQEIGRLLGLLGSTSTPVFEGSTEWLTGRESPQASPAAQDLVERALSSDAPLYVVAIGAPTNISSALLMAPEILERVVVVWLGGHSLAWPHAREFNLRQDPDASRVLFDSGVALVHVPCYGVADRLLTTRDEIEHWVRPAGEVGEFLTERYAEHVREGPGLSKVIWDLAATGWVLRNAWATTVLAHSPVLTNELTWSADPGRHIIGEVTYLDRDAIFGDFFERLALHAGNGAHQGRP